jgi:DNA-directed RNA polymerase alpha subunit
MILSEFDELAEVAFCEVLSLMRKAPGVPDNGKIMMHVEVRGEKLWFQMTFGELGDQGKVRVSREKFADVTVGSQEIFDRSVEDLGLSVRVLCSLANEGCYFSPHNDPQVVRTVGDLARMSPSDILRRRNLGRKSLAEVEAVLSKLGIQLGMRGPVGSGGAG